LPPGKSAFIALLSIPAFAALACVLPGGLFGGPDCTPQDSAILFQDDFSADCGWDRYSDQFGSVFYSGETYHIAVETSNQIYWANPGQAFGDVSVEVDAALVDGSNDNEFGVICRYSDINNFYAVVISSDGFYAFRKIVDGGALELIGYETFIASDAIRQGRETNHIRVDCVGSTLRLYVNGVFIDEVQDGDPVSGDVGLLAGTYEIDRTEIEFDNFTVRQP
jgi:hypothetical protein